jgi:hypothetical protein
MTPVREVALRARLPPPWLPGAAGDATVRLSGGRVE